MSPVPADPVYPAPYLIFGHIRLRLLWPEGASSKKSVKSVNALPSDLTQFIKSKCDASTLPHAEALGSLIKSMMTYEAEKRSTAEQALSHPFFQITPRDEGEGVRGGAGASNKSTPIPAPAAAGGGGGGGGMIAVGEKAQHGRTLTLADPAAAAAAIVSLGAGGGGGGGGGAESVLGSGGSGRQLRPRKPKTAA